LETLTGNASDFQLELLTGDWSEDDNAFVERAMDEFRSGIRDDRTLRTIVKDYQADFHYDTEFDAEDRAAGNQIECPSLTLYAEGKSGTT